MLDLRLFFADFVCNDETRKISSKIYTLSLLAIILKTFNITIDKFSFLSASFTVSSVNIAVILSLFVFSYTIQLFIVVVSENASHQEQSYLNAFDQSVAPTGAPEITHSSEDREIRNALREHVYRARSVRSGASIASCIAYFIIPTMVAFTIILKWRTEIFAAASLMVERF